MIQIDIDMPKRCEECPLCVDYDCIIHERVTDEYYASLNEQYAHCPLTMPSAQPTQNNTSNALKSLDCISREEAIDDLHGKDPSQIWDTADIEVWLNSLPPAQPTIELSAQPLDAQTAYYMGLHDGAKACN